MTLATFQDIQDAQATRSVELTQIGVASGGVTPPGAAGGGFVGSFCWNAIGTTLPGGPYTGFPLPAGIDSSKILRLLYAKPGGNRIASYWLGYLCKLGTVSLTATGQQFTHDAAGFPILRTRMGQTGQATPGWLFLNVTTAATITGPVFTLKYKDHLGNTITGTKTTTLGTTTAVNSMILPRLEDGSAGITDLVEINLSVAATTGAADVYLFEPLMGTCMPVVTHESVIDSVMSAGFNPPNIAPPAPTSGTLTSYLGFWQSPNSATTTGSMMATAVMDS